MSRVFILLKQLILSVAIGFATLNSSTQANPFAKVPNVPDYVPVPVPTKPSDLDPNNSNSIWREAGRDAEQKLREKQEQIEQTQQRAQDAIREAENRQRQIAEDAARGADRQRLEALHRAQAQLDQVRRDAVATMEQFNHLAGEYLQKLRAINTAQSMAHSRDAGQAREGYRMLQQLGVFQTNREVVLRSRRPRFGAFIPAKELDHIEQGAFAQALGASAVTANPGPALAYIQEFAMQSKAEFMHNLQNAPQEIQQQARDTFESLLIASLNAAINGGGQPSVAFEGVMLEAGLLTFNHWIRVDLRRPELRPNGMFGGIQLFRIEWQRDSRQLPLPNTFMPYVSLRAEAQTGFQAASALGSEMALQTNGKRREALRPAESYAGNLGFHYVKFAYRDGTFGARVTRHPEQGTPAANLGVEPGDIIFELDGQRFRTDADVLNHRNETSVRLINVRDGRTYAYDLQIP